MRTILAALVIFVTMPAYSLTINLTNLGGVGPGTDALAGFNAAKAIWESSFSDNITINLNVKYGTTTISGSPYGGSTLGSASSNKIVTTYSSFTGALTGDITTTDDITATNSLQSGSSFDMLLNRTRNNPNGVGSATPFIDDDGNANNTSVRVNRANMKAIGLLDANNTGTDASIGFNSNFSFDFDHSDGIGVSQFDFIGVAIHEIGHALGFVSGVDILDINSSSPYFFDYQFNDVSPLDMFRYSADSFADGIIDWTADTREKYFSIDGGMTNLAGFSTGSTWGADGHQASHWRDNLVLGIMDPTFAYGELGALKALDLQALDVIGYDLVTVPLPGAVWLFGGALLALVGRRRRRSALH